jgi:hypothetical protein
MSVTGKNAVTAPSLFFVRMHDSRSVAVIPRDKATLDQCITGDVLLEELLSDAAGLAPRTTWRVEGQVYLLGSNTCTVFTHEK